MYPNWYPQPGGRLCPNSTVSSRSVVNSQGHVKRHENNLGLRVVSRAIVATTLLIVCSVFAVAQSPALPSAVQASSTATSADTRYRIGTGDMLDIRVFNRPQFSREGVRVDSSGMIRMPLIPGEISAACRTESELATEITQRYLEYLRDPQVDVFIKEYNSQPVAVIGAVRSPSRFQLTRRVRLLELLAFAGGLADNAGRTVQVVHAGSGFSCDPSGKRIAFDTGLAGALDNYRLSDTLKGAMEANPFVDPGDVVSIPEAEQAFVVGNVFRPAIIALKEPVTVTRAIAMAGGTMPDTKSDRIRILRQAPGAPAKTEIIVDLKAINKQQAEDVVLMSGDIVEVPTAEGKRLFKSFLGAIVPSMAQLPIAVIP